MPKRRLGSRWLHLWVTRRQRALLRHVALEPEFALLAKLPIRYGLFLDIGAKDGGSALSFRLVERQSWIFSIEPDPAHERSLRRIQRLVPRFEYVIWATEDGRGDRRLDDLALAPDFIKIGLAGSELSVMEGLDETIRCCRPIILIAAAAVPAVDEHLRQLDYRVFGVADAADHVVAYESGAHNTAVCIPQGSPRTWRRRTLPQQSAASGADGPKQLGMPRSEDDTQTSRSPLDENLMLARGLPELQNSDNHQSMPSENNVALLPVVKRWWWALVLSTLVAGAIGFAVVSDAPKIYEAEVALLVGPVNTDVSLDASGALASTYANLATSDRALLAAIDETRAKLTLTELEESVTALSNQVTRIVTIAVEHRDPTTAARLANALARRLQAISTEIESSAATVLERFAQQPEIARLPALAQARVNRAATRVFGPSRAGLLTIIDPASPPESPSRPVVPLVVLLAAMGGLVIAGILILLKESRPAVPLDRRLPHF